MFGLVPFWKPVGMSSYDVIRRVKRWTGEKKIGHGGTLDPFAEGVLVLGIGRDGTRQLTRLLTGSSKVYEADVFLGATSTTDDVEGEIQETVSPVFPEKVEIQKALQSYVGEISQTPPVYSALKVKGQPAYKRVRRGETIKLKPRMVRIDTIELLDYRPPTLRIRVATGSGVYIRALARDIGKDLGLGGYLTGLVRMRVAEFSQFTAIRMEDIDANKVEVTGQVFGRVQRVGFRYFLRDMARQLGVTGFCQNNTDGQAVSFVAQGSFVSVREFVLAAQVGPDTANVADLLVQFRRQQEVFSDFQILPEISHLDEA